MARWIADWRPEDKGFWERTGRRTATRNLVFSIFAEHLGFSVWLLWSTVAVSLNKAGFHFGIAQLFWLVAVPNLVGSLLRLPYTFAVARFGGRNWTVFSAVSPLLITKTFPAVSAASFAFLGPLVGSLSRPFGGALADRVGGARVTVAVFAVQGACIPWVIASVHARSWPSYLAAFLAMFVTTGVGNGSTYRMIPAIFRSDAQRVADSDGADPQAALAAGRRDAAAALGIAGAVGALGGFLIPISLGISSPRGTAAFDPRSLDPAFIGFMAFYAVCAGVTWFCYLRRRALIRAAPARAGPGRGSRCSRGTSRPTPAGCARRAGPRLNCWTPRTGCARR